MGRPPRRVFLSVIGVSAFPTLGGCLGNRPSSDDSGALGEQSPSDDAQPIDFVVKQSGGGWNRTVERNPRSDVLWHGRKADALASLDDLDWRSDDERADVEEFIADMEMEREELLEIRSSGPSLFDDEIAVDTLARDDEEVRGAAHVITTDEPAPAEVAYPTALVRYEVGDDFPGTVRFEITDGWGGPREFPVER